MEGVHLFSFKNENRNKPLCQDTVTECNFSGFTSKKRSILLLKMTTLCSSSLVKQFQGTVTTIHSSLNHASIPAQKVISEFCFS